MVNKKFENIQIYPNLLRDLRSLCDDLLLWYLRTVYSMFLMF